MWLPSSIIISLTGPFTSRASRSASAAGTTRSSRPFTMKSGQVIFSATPTSERVAAFSRASASDWQWLRGIRGAFSEQEVPSGKLNVLEKAWFWLGACVLGIVVSAAGFVLDFPNFDQTRQTMQLAHMVHSVGAILFMLGALGHIYIGTIGMIGAYEGMRTGYVDETWAKEHHRLWYEEVKAGSVAPDVDPAAAPSQKPA